MKRLLLGVLAALCLLPAAAQAQVIFSTPPSCAKAGANTVTASAPVLDCTQTWNNAGITFYGFRLNVTDTASASASLLMDLQVAGVSKVSVDKAGLLTTSNGLSTQGNISIASAAGYFINNDVRLLRDAANTLALRNGASAQTFNIYNTYTDASNYERGIYSWQTNKLFIGNEKAGTGSARSVSIFSTGAIEFATNNISSAKWSVQSDGTFRAESDNTYDIGASGANRPRDVYLGRNLAVAGQGTFTGDVAWTGASHVYGGAVDGNIALYNGAKTSFGLLQFGGTTSSFPALKRSAVELDVRLADDSAPSDLGLRHLAPLGTAPAVTACGTSPSIVGGDTAGEVTTGTATPTACTITFAVAYAAQPYCLVEDRSTRTNLTSYTVSNSAIVLTTAAASSQKVVYHCIGA